MSGRVQNAVASLEVLPPEILLPIVMSLPGLETLWNLMTASPNTWRLFTNYAHNVTEGIISGANSILPTRVREVIRGVILARTETLPFRDLNQFQTGFLYAVFPFVQRKDAQDTTLGPEILSRSIVPIEVFRSVIATACQISALSQGCLASYLASFREIRPLHPSHPQPDANVSGTKSRRILPWDREVTGTPAKVIDAGQPSWTEEMRALRAMWTIQLVGEMKRLAKETWSEEDIDMLKQMNTTDLVERPDIEVEAEEIRSAMDYLTTLEDTTQDNYYRLPMPPLATNRHRRITAELQSFRNDAPPVWSPGRKSPQQLRDEDRAGRVATMALNIPGLTDDDKWCKSETTYNKESSGVHIWRFLSSRQKSPVCGVKFDSFRRLGFAFWDKKRLHLAGLAGGIHAPYHREDFYLFALESILPTDEVAAMKARRRLFPYPDRTLPPRRRMARSRHYARTLNSPSAGLL